jgi:opacity protein-like surface antigen
MGGLGYRVSDQVVLDVGYRYFSTIDGTFDAILVGFGAGEVEGQAASHEVVFAVRYEF